MKVLMNRNKAMMAAAALVALIAAVWLALKHEPASAAMQKAPPPINVETAGVTKADVPIYLQGLGTVQAVYTVTVTARVDGALEKGGVVEGQTVPKGDLLAQ